MSDTDWKHIRNMTDEAALQNALDDPDNPPLKEGEMANAARDCDLPGSTPAEKFQNLKKNKKLVSIRYDADVLEYFRAKGKGYQSAMNNALRAFMEAEKAHGFSD